MKLTKKEKEFILLGRKRWKTAIRSRKITAYRKASNPSKGERKIVDFLVKESVDFKREWYFNGCFSKTSNHLLYFDFYLPAYNLVIEYDGEQHYSFDKPEKAQANDFIKNAYCLKNRINLLRIKYTDYENIERLICEKVDKITNTVY